MVASSGGGNGDIIMRGVPLLLARLGRLPRRNILLGLRFFCRFLGDKCWGNFLGLNFLAKDLALGTNIDPMVNRFGDGLRRACSDERSPRVRHEAKASKRVT